MPERPIDIIIQVCTLKRYPVIRHLARSRQERRLEKINDNKPTNRKINVTSQGWESRNIRFNESWIKLHIMPK